MCFVITSTQGFQVSMSCEFAMANGLSVISSPIHLPTQQLYLIFVLPHCLALFCFTYLPTTVFPYPILPHLLAWLCFGYTLHCLLAHFDVILCLTMCGITLLHCTPCTAHPHPILPSCSSLTLACLALSQGHALLCLSLFVLCSLGQMCLQLSVSKPQLISHVLSHSAACS